MRGVPLRLEIGPKDIEKSQVLLARRDTREKAVAADGRAGRADRRRCCDEIQAGAVRPRAASSARSTRPRVELVRRVQGGDGRPPGLRHRRWCGSAECEAEIKAETQATLRNIPFDESARTVRALKCGKPAVRGLVREGILTRRRYASQSREGAASAIFFSAAWRLVSSSPLDDRAQHTRR